MMQKGSPSAIGRLKMMIVVFITVVVLVLFFAVVYIVLGMGAVKKVGAPLPEDEVVSSAVSDTESEENVLFDDINRTSQAVEESAGDSIENSTGYSASFEEEEELEETGNGSLSNQNTGGTKKDPVSKPEDTSKPSAPNDKNNTGNQGLTAPIQDGEWGTPIKN